MTATAEQAELLRAENQAAVERMAADGAAPTEGDLLRWRLDFVTFVMLAALSEKADAEGVVSDFNLGWERHLAEDLRARETALAEQRMSIVPPHEQMSFEGALADD